MALSISTTTIFIPSQIWIILEIRTETIGASALIFDDAPCQLSPLHWILHLLLPCIRERLKYNYMHL